MSLGTSNPYAQGIFNAVKQTFGLFQDYNKVSDVKAGGEESGGDEYESTFTETEVLNLTKGWKAQYSVYYGDIETTQTASFDYWIGKHKVDTMEAIDGHNVVDNLIFEAVETFLPIATRSNPDPLVTSDDSPEGIKLAYNIKNALVYQADKQKLRMKLKRGVRQWTLNRLGCWKVGYDTQIDDIETEVINPKRLILDPDGYVNEAGIFIGEYIGEKRKASATKLAEMFPNKKQEILLAAKGKMGTKIDYIEWWYRGTDVFYTMETSVLGKFKNPHWNYDGEEEIEGPDGVKIKRQIQGRNHFPVMMAPYVFLSVFSTGQHPHDDTSLIIQNIPMQDMVNKRFRQIDKNVDSQNNGMIVSGDYYTKEQAAEVSSFLRKGGTVWQPSGDVNAGSKRDQAPQLAGDVYNQLVDSRSELRNIFGTSGSTPQGLDSTETVRGKIMVSQSDSTRIGGGVTEYIEQDADTIYNWWVQMMYVHYDLPHYVQAMGINGAQETIQIRNLDFTNDIQVTVKEGSLIPKDPLTQRNEAMDLWEGNAISLIDLYKKLDFPDPQASAKQTLIWQMVAAGQLPPQTLFPDFPAPMAMGADGVGTQAIDETTSIEPDGSMTPSDAVAGQSSDILASVPI